MGGGCHPLQRLHVIACLGVSLLERPGVCRAAQVHQERLRLSATSLLKFMSVVRLLIFFKNKKAWTMLGRLGPVAFAAGVGALVPSCPAPALISVACAPHPAGGVRAPKHPVRVCPHPTCHTDIHLVCTHLQPQVAWRAARIASKRVFSSAAPNVRACLARPVSLGAASQRRAAACGWVCVCV